MQCEPGWLKYGHISFQDDSLTWLLGADCWLGAQPGLEPRDLGSPPYEPLYRLFALPHSMVAGFSEQAYQENNMEVHDVFMI